MNAISHLFGARVSAILLLPVALAASILLGGCSSGASIRAERLACEFRDNPTGIGTTTPRLSWKLAATDPDERGVSMGGYQVIVAPTREALVAGTSLLWDSGQVLRAAASSGDIPPLPCRAEYAGPTLRSRDHAWWKVRVWDQTGRASGWSDPAHFSIGLLASSDWQAQWVGLDDPPAAPLTQAIRDELRKRPWIRSPGAPERHERIAFFRSEFDLASETIDFAWLAGTADMVASVRINGREIAQLTRWDPIRAIGIAPSLIRGKNTLAIRVENHDGFNPAVSGMLLIRFASGREQRITLDKSFKRSDAEAPGWELAGFDDSAWKAAEESSGQPWGGSRNTEHYMPPAPYLRTTFTTSSNNRIARATLYATALGVYECSLNDRRIGDAEFAPGWTEYTKRVEHQTYDVTSLIRPGDNCLGAILGDGWYAGLMGYTGRRRYYGGPARFMGQLEIEYTDGTRQTIVTGPDWLASFGPIRHADNYMGTDYDSRLEMPGWNTPRFDAAAWKHVETGLPPPPARRESDVTDKVRAALKGSSASLLVGPAALGDPAYGVVKTLRVNYTAGGEPREMALREGERLVLPRLGESGPIIITSATFGEPAATPAPPMLIQPARADPVKRHEQLPAKSVSEPRPGRYVFDLGQNMVGWVRLKVFGTPGQRLTIRHAEMLNPDGTLYTSNLRGATATDFFTLRGGGCGPETLEPPFTFHGFRYVEITGLTGSPAPSMVTGIVAHSAMTPSGTFTCSSPLINQLVHNIVWGQKGNYFEIPTDCPQRDERLGWTGDAQFFINTAAYNFDIAAFMSRWLCTLNHDAQFEDGTLAHVAPKVNERGGSTAWGDAGIVCTHALYMAYADTRVINDNYDAMCRYIAWLETKTTDNIAKVGGFGDWVNLKDPTDQGLIDTAYRAHLLQLMSEMAAAIGKPEDAKQFAAKHSATVAAFRAKFLRPDGALTQSGQTGYALAFTMGLIPQDQHESAAAHFAGTIEKKHYHLATGFIGTPRLLPALYNSGQPDLAARLLLNEDFPSWLYQVKLGATTMWERWDGWTPEKGFQDVGMNSFNHYAFGSVGDYLYRHVAGIAPLAPGYARVLIAPTLVPGLEHAAASYDSNAGTIKSDWRREANQVSFEITIPPNTSGEIHLPLFSGATLADIRESGQPLEASSGLNLLGPVGDRVRLRATSGTYHFVIHPSSR